MQYGGTTMSEMMDAWFERAKELDIGEAIYIRVGDKKEQTATARELEEIKERFSEVDQTLASQLFINKVLKETKQYVVIERKFRAPFTAIFRSKDGKFSTISIDPERKRIIRLMLKDGLSRDAIETALNGLTDEEISAFFN
jgi:hypothetical protein